MEKRDFVKYHGNENSNIRVLILGNSITLHEPAKDIGWYGEWGMASSSIEKDYVHLLYEMLKEKGLDAYFRIKKCVFWELGLKEKDILYDFDEDKAFDANIIIFRLGENVPIEDEHLFKESTISLLNYIKGEKSKIYLTNCFWPSNRDSIIFEIAKEFGYPCANINGSNSDKALGSFENDAVANHPGDSGMKMIATKILDILDI